MASTASSPYARNGPTRSRWSPAYAVLALPLAGMFGFFWVVSHRVSKPDISIFTAVDQGDLKAVKDHLVTGTPIDSVSTTGHTALYTAIFDKRPEMVKFLLDNGASVSAEERTELTPLYVAAGQGDFDLVNDLLDRGAKADEVYKHGATALHAAADAGNPQVVKILLEHGANPNARNVSTGGTPLSNAAINGNMDSVNLLLKYGADINLRGNLDRTPVHLACPAGNFEVVKRLVEVGAKTELQDVSGLTPLASALSKSSRERISWLLMKHTTKFNVVDSKSHNLLYWAVAGRNEPAMIEALIAKGCDPNHRDFNGETALTSAHALGLTRLEDVMLKHGGHIYLRALIERALRGQPVRGGAGAFLSVE